MIEWKFLLSDNAQIVYMAPTAEDDEDLEDRVQSDPFGWLWLPGDSNDIYLDFANVKAVIRTPVCQSSESAPVGLPVEQASPTPPPNCS